MFYQFNHSLRSDYLVKEYGENFDFPAHLHGAFEFVTVFSGKMYVTLDGVEFSIRKGEGALIFPNQVHSLKGEECRHMLLIFTPDLVKAYYSPLSDKIPAKNQFSPSESIISSFNSLTDSASIIEKKGLLYSLCAEFDKSAEYISSDKGDKNLLRVIFKFVENELLNDCSLKTLAEKTGFSYFYLSRYFKTLVGISYNDYVNQCRINNACYLLTNTDKTVLECAMDSGYGSLRSFNRNFIAITGSTPGDYRKNAYRQKKNSAPF